MTTKLRSFCFALVFMVYCVTSTGACEEQIALKVGVTSILSGDLAVLGENIVKSVSTYRRYYLRHKIDFVYEDARLSSADGLKAYQKLINLDRVDFIICGNSSNGTMAAKALINSSRTPTISVVTGGKNIDAAGPYVFRIGNSDRLNGLQEAEAFLSARNRKVALLAEETEYTQDIALAFAPHFMANGGSLVYQSNFLPNTSDFRAEITAIKRSGAEAIFMPTQTGLAFGIFLKQWRELGGGTTIPIHTTFVAAPNPEAHKVAGDTIFGTYYMAPLYDQSNPRWPAFLKHYKEDHGHEPPIPFHTAGSVDSLDLLQNYLDTHPRFEREDFRNYLLSQVKDYRGLMGVFSFDAEGNSNLGFKLAQITREKEGAVE